MGLDLDEIIARTKNKETRSSVPTSSDSESDLNDSLSRFYDIVNTKKATARPKQVDDTQQQQQRTTDEIALQFLRQARGAVEKKQAAVSTGTDGRSNSGMRGGRGNSSGVNVEDHGATTKSKKKKMKDRLDMDAIGKEESLNATNNASTQSRQEKKKPSRRNAKDALSASANLRASWTNISSAFQSNAAASEQDISEQLRKHSGKDLDGSLKNSGMDGSLNGREDTKQQQEEEEKEIEIMKQDASGKAKIPSSEVIDDGIDSSYSSRESEAPKVRFAPRQESDFLSSILKQDASGSEAKIPSREVIDDGIDSSYSSRSLNTEESSIADFDDSDPDADREAAVLEKLRSTVGVVSNFKSLTQKVIAAQRTANYKKEDEKDSELGPSDMTLTLWRDTAGRIAVIEDDKEAIIEIKGLHDALEAAKKYYLTSTECRNFVNDNLKPIINLILSKSPESLSTTPDKFGITDNAYAEKTIRFALQLITKDLQLNAHKFTAKCSTLDALPLLLSHDNAFYEGSPDEVRMEKVTIFQRIKGFKHLAIYFNARSGTGCEANWFLIHKAIEAALEGIVFLQHNPDHADFLLKFRSDAMSMALGCMKFLCATENDVLAGVEVEKISSIVSELKSLFENIATVKHKAMPKYFHFCQDAILKMLSTESTEHKEYGKELMCKTIHAIHGTRPLNGAFVVKRAGLAACNGIYNLSSHDRDKDGNMIPGLNPRYERIVKGTNQKLVLFLDTDEESKQQQWCISEEHGDEAIVSNFTDYYTNKTRVGTLSPPVSGWIATEEANKPAPSLEPVHIEIPVRKDHTALKMELARWFLEKNLLKLALGINVNTSADSSSIIKLSEAIDSFIDGGMASDQMTNLYAHILPSISMAPSATSTRAQSDETYGKAAALAIETAKQNVAAAERWKETTSSMLRSAQKEDESAAEMVEKARQYLEKLEGQQNNDKFPASKPLRKDSVEDSSVHKDNNEDFNRSDLSLNASLTSLFSRKEKTGKHKKNPKSTSYSSDTEQSTSSRKRGTGKRKIKKGSQSLTAPESDSAALSSLMKTPSVPSLTPDFGGFSTKLFGRH